MDETSSCYIQTQSYYAHSAQDKHLDGTFHLTILMCAKHRSQKFDESRGRLKNGKSYRVIATSLIEAGVDVDFPLVMRAEAGLDSVAQAAVMRLAADNFSDDLIPQIFDFSTLQAIYIACSLNFARFEFGESM